MIPSDLAARLRMLTEASLFESGPPLTGATRIREIQGRLPDLLPGQSFVATLQRPLPDGTFQAVVAGKTYTLALNHAAKSGDTLELVVVKNTPQAVVAQLASPAVASGAAPPPNLSATGRLIGFLLTGQPASQPAALAGGQPLLDAPPANGGASLAPALRQALTQSGLFYESHQLHWLSGKLDTAALRQEPQGQQFLPVVARDPGAATAGAAEVPSVPATLREGAPAALQRQSIATGDGADSFGSTAAATQTPARASVIPERLLPIVHQQLDGMATQQYVWQGQVWPGQTVEWEIEDPARDGRGHEEEDAPGWNTTLRLTLPRLGGVEARIVLSPAGIALRLLADEPGTVAALDAARARLGDALDAANVPLTGFVAEARDGNG
jgi:hypothetical protein